MQFCISENNNNNSCFCGKVCGQGHFLGLAKGRVIKQYITNLLHVTSLFQKFAPQTVFFQFVPSSFNQSVSHFTSRQFIKTSTAHF